MTVLPARAQATTRGVTSATRTAYAVKPTSSWAYPQVVRTSPKITSRRNGRSRSTAR